jgi:hypothetical protein
MTSRVSELRILPPGLFAIATYIVGWSIVLFNTVQDRVLATAGLVLFCAIAAMAVGLGIWLWSQTRLHVQLPPDDLIRGTARRAVLLVVGELVAVGLLWLLLVLTDLERMRVPVLAIPFALGSYGVGEIMQRRFDAIGATLMTLACAVGAVTIFGSGYASWINPMIALLLAIGCSLFGMFFVFHGLALLGLAMAEYPKHPTEEPNDR